MFSGYNIKVRDAQSSYCSFWQITTGWMTYNRLLIKWEHVNTARNFKWPTARSATTWAVKVTESWSLAGSKGKYLASKATFSLVFFIFTDTNKPYPRQKFPLKWLLRNLVTLNWNRMTTGFQWWKESKDHYETAVCVGNICLAGSSDTVSSLEIFELCPRVVD